MNPFMFEFSHAISFNIFAKQLMELRSKNRSIDQTKEKILEILNISEEILRSHKRDLQCFTESVVQKNAVNELSDKLILLDLLKRKVTIELIDDLDNFLIDTAVILSSIQTTLQNISIKFVETVEGRVIFSFDVDEKKILLTEKKYGFSEIAEVIMHPKRVHLPILSRISQDMYDQILTLQKAPLQWVLECCGKIVNESMEYDFSRDKVKENVRAAQVSYHTSGNETIKGVCTDAGLLIRRIIRSLGLPKEYIILKTGINWKSVLHDVTLIVDKATRRWVAINSKSPTKEFVIVPLSSLADWKSIYFTIGEDSIFYDPLQDVL